MDKMKLAVVGSGYVGTTVGTGLAVKGHNVVFIDIDESKVDKINNGKLPLHDETLEDPFERAFSKGRLNASTDYSSLENREIVFIAAPTPSKKNGSIDLKYVENVAESIGKNIDLMKDPLVVVKSTVLPGSTEENVVPKIEEQSGLTKGQDFEVCINPEFLREGNAYHDFLEPDRIVIGELNERSGDRLEELYRDFDAPVFRTGLKEAEMIKYTSNSLLASKISFANEIGNLCKEMDIDSYEVMDAVGMDHRIERDFLDSGVGFGGSCFPKDVKAIVKKAENAGVKTRVLDGVLKTNEEQRERFVELAERKYGELNGRDVGVLGLSFKPGTDDIRESPAITVIEKLLEKNCNIHAHDPKALKNMEELYPDINYYREPEQVIENSELVKIMTDWSQFSQLEKYFEEKETEVMEGRRMFPENENVEGICW